MKKGNALGLFFVLCAFLVMGFFMIGFTSSVQAPSAGTDAAYQFDNLSKVVSVADTGMNAFILLLIAALVLTGIMLVYNAFGKRK